MLVVKSSMQEDIVLNMRTGHNLNEEKLYSGTLTVIFDTCFMMHHVQQVETSDVSTT